MIVLVVPNPMLVAVAVENDGTLAELFLQTIGIELRLLLAHAGIAFGALRLDQPKGFTVIAPEDVINEAFAFLVRHSGNRVLAVLPLVQGPSGFLEEQVNEVVSGFGLGVVVGVWCLRVLFLDGGDLGSQTFQFGIKSGLTRQQFCKFRVFFRELRFKLLKLRQSTPANGVARQ